jgi:uncharacterized protein YqjF (DUF2071 family)
MPNPPEIDRVAPTLRPDETVLGYQKWRDLLFVHWRAPGEIVRLLLPPRLTLDTFDGDAWIGLVPFTMRGVRPRWVPPVPGLSQFHETNLRTYVHAGGVPGVWFFSLDAASSLAVKAARWLVSLPYFRSEMTLRRDRDTIRYTGDRRWPEPQEADYDVTAEIGPPFPTAAVPGTLDHFLIERYVLFTRRPDGSLWRGRIHHISYPLREARVTGLNESLSAAAGLPKRGDVAHACFSEGVDVEFFPLTRV